MINAYKEFQKHIAEVGVPVVAVEVGFKIGLHTFKRVGRALKRLLDVEYDNGFGSQELFGTIWYADGTWSSREEYDGSEYWGYHKCPELPK